MTTFDALHDMGDPVGAAKRVHEALAPDGVWLLVEPAAGDRVEDNLNPVGRAYYGFSTLLCTPASLSQPVGAALGTQAGPARIRDVTARPASAASGSRRRPRSTTCSRCGRDVAGLDPRGVREDGGCEDGSHLYAVHGSGPATVVLLPAWSIVRRGCGRRRCRYLARHHRVVTFDGRGSGGSDRPTGAAAYANAEYAADTVAVMDAVGVDRAVLVGLSSGAAWAAQVAAEHPDRVQGLVAIGPVCASWQPRGQVELATYTEPQRRHRGLGEVQPAPLARRRLRRLRRVLLRADVPRAALDPPARGGVGWAHEVAPQTLVDCTPGGSGSTAPRPPTSGRCSRR